MAVLSITKVVSNTLVSAQSVNAGYLDIENFLNGVVANANITLTGTLLGKTLTDGVATLNEGNLSGLQGNLILPKSGDADRNFLRWTQGVNNWQTGFRASPYTWVLEYQSETSPDNDTGWTSVIAATKEGKIGIGVTPTIASLEIKSGDNSNTIFGRNTAGVMVSNLFIDGSGRGGFDLRDETSTIQAQVLASGVSFFNGGNVGIGTTTPDASLDVVGTSGRVLFQNTKDNATTKSYRLGGSHFLNTEEPFYGIFSFSDSSNNCLNIGGGTSEGNAATVIKFFTASDQMTVTGSEKMRIDKDGRVGIGATLSSNVHHKLHVAAQPGALNINRNSGIFIDSTGYTGGGSGAHSFIQFSTPIYKMGAANEGLEIGIEDSTGLAYFSRNQEDGSNSLKGFVIDMVGNIGIGTVIPSFKLQVAGSIGPVSDGSNDLGAGSNRWRDIYSLNPITQPSDLRLKKYIKPCPVGLDFLSEIKPIEFKWKNKEDRGNSESHYGLGAQDIKGILKDFQMSLKNFPPLSYDDIGDQYLLRMTEFIPIIINGINDLHHKIKEMQKKIK